MVVSGWLRVAAPVMMSIRVGASLSTSVVTVTVDMDTASAICRVVGLFVATAGDFVVAAAAPLRMSTSLVVTTASEVFSSKSSGSAVVSATTVVVVTATSIFASVVTRISAESSDGKTKSDEGVVRGVVESAARLPTVVSSPPSVLCSVTAKGASEVVTASAVLGTDLAAAAPFVVSSSAVGAVVSATGFSLDSVVISYDAFDVVSCLTVVVSLTTFSIISVVTVAIPPTSKGVSSAEIFSVVSGVSSNISSSPGESSSASMRDLTVVWSATAASTG